ncbi:MAG: hypothetical protein AAF351_00600 [Pseudomonadota bacterium]
MLLRRITQHVKEQNWFAVCIDFLIVVVGIFVGLQVQEWNENRKDRVEAEEYRQRLLADMQLSVATNQDQIGQNRIQVEGMDLVLAALNQCELPEEDESTFAGGLYNMGKINMPAMVTGTLDELNATGRFPLVGDVDLRRTITEATRRFETVDGIEGQVTSRMIPSISYVRERIRFSINEHRFTGNPIAPTEVHYDFASICTDPKFANAIANVREMTLAIIALTEDIIEHQTTVSGALKIAIKGAPQAGISE